MSISKMTAENTLLPPILDGVIDQEATMISREVFNWGVRLTARPFKGNQRGVIRSEIRNHNAGCRSEVHITFSAASTDKPFHLRDAQTWWKALSAIIADTRAVQTEMKAAADSAGKKKR